jgi:hypothetical protein
MENEAIEAYQSNGPFGGKGARRRGRDVLRHRPPSATPSTTPSACG